MLIKKKKISCRMCIFCMIAFCQIVAVALAVDESQQNNKPRTDDFLNSWSSTEDSATNKPVRKQIRGVDILNKIDSGGYPALEQDIYTGTERGKAITDAADMQFRDVSGAVDRGYIGREGRGMIGELLSGIPRGVYLIGTGLIKTGVATSELVSGKSKKLRPSLTEKIAQWESINQDEFLGLGRVEDQSFGELAGGYVGEGGLVTLLGRNFEGILFLSALFSVSWLFLHQQLGKSKKRWFWGCSLLPGGYVLFMLPFTIQKGAEQYKRLKEVGGFKWPWSQSDTFKASDEDGFYKQAYDEIENGKTDKVLWAKIYCQCKGDENKAKALYLKHRVACLKKDHKNT